MVLAAMIGKRLEGRCGSGVGIGVEEVLLVLLGKSEMHPTAKYTSIC